MWDVIHMNSVEAKRSFDKDQQSTREFRISEEVGVVYQEEMERLNSTLNEAREQRDNINIKYAMGSSDTEESVTDNIVLSDYNISLNRSGVSRKTAPTKDASIQICSPVPQPRIRVNRNCTESIKATCEKISPVCGVSAETTRQAVKTVCKNFYNHDFYLSIEEAQDDTLEVCEPEPKRSKRPVTKKGYESYEFVLPSAKTISDHKYLQASQAQSNVALAMLSKVNDVKIILHYDTASRNSIDGEWSSIGINFSDKQHFRLRPLFFAHEGRA